MKKFVFAIILCISFLTINQYANAAMATEKKAAGYISLNSTMTKEVEPNVAKITFAVENIGTDAQKATTENNIISNTIINALKAITTEATDTIKTTNFSVRPIYVTNNGKKVIKNYTAVNSITVETKDINKVAKLIDTAIVNGANRVNGLSYSVENEKKICTDLYTEMIKDLKVQATTLAQAAGTTIDGLKYMNATCNMDSVVSNGRYYAKSAAMDSASTSDLGTPVEAGKVKIRVYVNADFYVK
ncbi:SIMPL domain-containing protein [bacterium]|nr:SIMPL domain-containing protein [bacterium]